MELAVANVWFLAAAFSKDLFTSSPVKRNEDQADEASKEQEKLLCSGVTKQIGSDKNNRC